MKFINKNNIFIFNYVNCTYLCNHGYGSDKCSSCIFISLDIFQTTFNKVYLKKKKREDGDTIEKEEKQLDSNV